MPCILIFTLSCQVAKLFEQPSYVLINIFALIRLRVSSHPGPLSLQLSGQWIIINGKRECKLQQPVVRVTTAQVGSLGLRVGIRLLHSSNEPDELSQWLYNDNSIVNVVLGSVCC